MTRACINALDPVSLYDEEHAEQHAYIDLLVLKRSTCFIATPRGSSLSYMVERFKAFDEGDYGGDLLKRRGMVVTSYLQAWGFEGGGDNSLPVYFCCDDKIYVIYTWSKFVHFSESNLLLSNLEFSYIWFSYNQFLVHKSTKWAKFWIFTCPEFLIRCYVLLQFFTFKKKKHERSYNLIQKNLFCLVIKPGSTFDFSYSFYVVLL